MKATFTALLCFFALHSQAQKWAPKGMTRTYVFQATGFGPGRSEIVTWVAEDTMTLKGHLCTIIQPKGMSTNIGNMLISMATYEDSGRVYWYSPVSKDFSILYDFNKKTGESWMIYGIQKPGFGDIGSPDTVSCPLKVTVTDVGTETINGIPLRTMQLKTSPSYMIFEGKVIEGIGHLVRPRPWAAMLQYCSPVADVADDYFGLRCIDNGSIGFHDFKIAPDCEWKSTSINDYKNQNVGIKISPNPSNGQFTISLSESATQKVSVSIFDLLGRLVQTSKQILYNNETVVRLNCANGTYFISIQNDQGLNAREILIVNNQ